MNESSLRKPKLDESGSATMSGYEGQDYALVEIVDHQRRYSKVEK